jgi:hypothetical protein
MNAAIIALVAAFAIPLVTALALVNPDVTDEFVAGSGSERLSGSCSASEQNWVRAAKHAWFGAIGAAGAVCCLGTSVQTGGAACVACTVLAGVAMGAGEDIADDYCA